MKSAFFTAPPTTPAPTTTTSSTTVSTTSTTEAVVQAQNETQRLPDVDLEEDITVSLTVTPGEETKVVYVDEGTDYTVRCNAPAGQSVEWIAEDGQTLNDNGRGILRILRASQASVGLFRCRSQSEASFSVAVDVRLNAAIRGNHIDTHASRRILFLFLNIKSSKF